MLAASLLAALLDPLHPEALTYEPEADGRFNDWNPAVRCP